MGSSRPGPMAWVPLCFALFALGGTGALTSCASNARRASPPAASRPPPTAPEGPHGASFAPSTLSSSTLPPSTFPPSTPPTTRPAPPTTAAPPPLRVPTVLTPLASPALPGEGRWLPVAGERLRRGYGIYTTQLRAGAGYPPAGLAWIDSAATRVALYAGTSEPYGTWPQQGAVAASVSPELLAAFNGWLQDLLL